MHYLNLKTAQLAFSSAQQPSPRRVLSLAHGLLRPGPRAPAHGSACACGSGPSQPGPGPPFLSPAWAKSSPHTRGTISAVGSRSTNARGCRRIKNRTTQPFPPNPRSFTPPPIPVAFVFLSPSERASGGRAGDDRAGGATASPLAGARVHRRVGTPPSSGISVAPRSTARRAAPRRLARPRSTRDPRPRWILSACRRPEHTDGGWRTKNKVSSPVTVTPLLCVV
jgi:hypothetical protein